MPERDAVRKNLLNVYQRLSSLEQSLIHLCSVIHEPTTEPVIYSCFRKTHLTTQYPHITSLKDIRPILHHIHEMDLLTDQWQCHPDFMELAIRQAAGHSDTAYFPDLIHAVHEIMPFSDYHRYTAGSEQHAYRLMRDFRIGIYTGTPPVYLECYRQLTSQYALDANYIDPFVQIFQNPFDPDWFRLLPMDVRVRALIAIFSHTLSHLEPDTDALKYSLSTEFLNHLSESEKAEFYSHLLTRLLLGAQTAAVRDLLSETDASPLLGGFSGWACLLEDQAQTAVQLFETDLEHLQKYTKNKTAYFKGLVGVFYILSLLRQAGSVLFEKMEAALKAARSNKYQGNVLETLFALLNAIGHIQKFETDTANGILSGIQTVNNPLVAYFSALTEYGITHTLSSTSLERLSQLFNLAKNAGLHWLAMECAVLLNASTTPDEERMDYARCVQAENGIHSILSIIEPEEPWRTRLHALTYSLNSTSPNSLKPGSLRLAWAIRLKDQSIELLPREQKRMTSGTWSPGKILPLARLYNNSQIDYLTRQDQILCACLQKVKHNSRVYQYFFDWDKALPALIGHPLVFLHDQPSFPIEIVRGEPKIIVESLDASLIMKFSPMMIEHRIAVTRETAPNRLSIVCLNAEQQRIARIVGNKGLLIPVSAKKDVLKAIAAMSSVITVHSAISEAAASMIGIDPDPLPHIHLTSFPSGFRVEIFVQPFIRGGFKLKPGEGTETVVTDIDGQSYQIQRNRVQELENARDVVAGCQTLSQFPNQNWHWMIADPYVFLDILFDLNALQQQGRIIVEWPEGEKLRVTRETSVSDLRVRIRGKSDCFEISGQLVVDDALVLELKDVIALIPRIHKRFVPLGEGQFLALTEDLKNQLKAISTFTELRNRALQFHPAAALTIDGLTQNLTHLETDEKWRTQLDRIKGGSTHSPQIPKDLKATLREYQIEGYTWLSRLSFWGVGACLADDMGLGKTIQVLAILLERAPNGPSLVIAPASVCLNWIDEIHRFAPALNVVRLEDQHRETAIRDMTPLDVLVVSYGLLTHASGLLSSRTWETVVLDEAQVIKNMKAKRSQAAMTLKGKFRIITTGTPIENHLGELFTLFNFINPGLLGSPRHFFNTFIDPIEKQQDSETRDRLKKIIQPFILRRMKSQVLAELPPLTEIMLQVDLYPGEAAFYESLRKNCLKQLETSRTDAKRDYQFRVFGEITKLRQACCHSRLIQPASRIPSAKLDLFERLVSDLLENRHKMLVFSQFVGYLTLIRELLDHKRIGYRYLDGRTAMRDRKSEIDAFQAGDGDVFLISLKAGGLGLNLTSADYVIHMDPWWNPAVEAQASDRAHRIGQERPVTVYRLVARNTIEEKIVALHRHKRNLARTLLEGGDVSGRISAEELLQLIQKEHQ
ncbi:MAG: DEAD/DEAH box helicase [Deltaproteobacteria bacterium]|nr:DEAD/DEAH box helicase [Deltaproteobacteria bacterium]